MHLPWAMACALDAACLVYLVRSVTVTVACCGPPGSLVLTVMVSPATEATMPRIGGWFPRGGDDGPPGGGAGGVEPAGGAWGSGQLPLTAWLTRTICTVNAPLCGFCPRAGRRVTQLPGVTSGRLAVETSVTVVEGVKSTFKLAAFPLCAVTWMVSPDTDAIRPATR